MHLFYLHEDEWGMIAILPAENAAWVEGTAREAERASRENFAGLVEIAGGQIPVYNDIYVVPEEEQPISSRAITLDYLRALLAHTWHEAERVETGYSTHVEEAKNAFAFGKAYGDTGSFYGSHRDGTITHLNITRPDHGNAEMVEAFRAALARLGAEHDLMLVDWWRNSALDLRDAAGINAYLAGDE
jgi:hypothetical protein